jgi:hypothetical protein
MRPHEGVTDMNPEAVVREFPNHSATLVAKTMTDVMAADPILVNVVLSPDTASKEFRQFSKADRQALGIGPMSLENDVNYNVQGKSRDGHDVNVAIRLKGATGAEVSVVYGYGGDPEMSRDLLDKLAVALATPAATKDGAVAKTSGSKPRSAIQERPVDDR